MMLPGKLECEQLMGNWGMINDTHSKHMVIASATRSPMYLHEMISMSLVDMMDKNKKKRKAMEPPSHAPSKILLIVVQNLYDFANLASVSYIGL